MSKKLSELSFEKLKAHYRNGRLVGVGHDSGDHNHRYRGGVGLVGVARDGV